MLCYNFHADVHYNMISAINYVVTYNMLIFLLYILTHTIMFLKEGS